MSRIAILEFGHLGDGILTLPLLSAISQSGEQHEVVVVGESRLKEAFSLLERPPRHIQFSHYYNARPHPTALKAVYKSARLATHLMRLKVDVCIETRGHRSTAGYSLLCLGAKRIGPSNKGGSALFHDTIASVAEPEALRKLRFADALGVPRPSRLYELNLPEGAILGVDAMLKSSGINGSYAVLHCCTPWRPRDWPIERYFELIQRLAGAGLENVVFVGSTPITDNALILPRLSVNFADLSARLSFAELAALLSRAALFVGSDSAPAHLAAACECPSVVMVGPAEYPRFAPYNPAAPIKIVRHEVCEWQSADNVCKQIFGTDVCARGDNICMKSISVEEVTVECAKLLAHAGHKLP